MDLFISKRELTSHGRQLVAGQLIPRELCAGLAWVEARAGVPAHNQYAVAFVPGNYDPVDCPEEGCGARFINQASAERHVALVHAPKPEPRPERVELAAARAACLAAGAAKREAEDACSLALAHLHKFERRFAEPITEPADRAEQQELLQAFDRADAERKRAGALWDAARHHLRSVV